jgi:hypothetical protein
MLTAIMTANNLLLLLLAANNLFPENFMLLMLAAIMTANNLLLLLLAANNLLMLLLLAEKQLEQGHSRSEALRLT